MKKSYVKQLLIQPQAKFTLKLPIIPEEGSDKNSWSNNSRQQSDWLMKCYMTIGKHPLSILLIPASSTISLNSLTNTPPKSSTTITSSRNMPRSYQYKTLNIPHHSVSSSPIRYSPSHHYAGQHISPESFAEAIKQCDNLASVVALLQGNPVSFAKFIFLEYLCQDLQKICQNLLNQEHMARQRLIRFFQQQSTDQVYDWMLNWWYNHPQIVPGSDHTPPDSSTDSSQSWPLPIPPWLSHAPPIHIQTLPTITEAWWHQWRQEFLEEEFPEDPLEGTRENPIIIEWTSFEN